MQAEFATQSDYLAVGSNDPNRRHYDLRPRHTTHTTQTDLTLNNVLIAFVFLEFCKVKRVITLCGKSEVWHRIPILLTCFWFKCWQWGKITVRNIFGNVQCFVVCYMLLLFVSDLPLQTMYFGPYVLSCMPVWTLLLHTPVWFCYFVNFSCMRLFKMGGSHILNAVLWTRTHGERVKSKEMMVALLLTTTVPQLLYFCLLRYQSVLFPVMYSLFHMCVRRLCWCKQL